MKRTDLFAIVTVMVLAILVAIPTAYYGHLTGKASTMSKCGKNIYVELKINEVNAGLTVWPRDPDGIAVSIDHRREWLYAKNSTDFFYHFLKNACTDLANGTERCGRLGLNDLSAGLVKTSKDLYHFTSTNNAWTVIKNCPSEEVMPNVPVLFSRNLDAATFTERFTPRLQATNMIAFNANHNTTKLQACAVIVYNDGKIMSFRHRKSHLLWSTIYRNRALFSDVKVASLKYLTPDSEVNPIGSQGKEYEAE